MLSIDTASTEDKRHQLELQLREYVRGGSLKPGEKLPSTRELAKALGISRNTAMAAYEQLVAEGYLEARVGSGTHVSGQLLRGLLCGEASARNSRSAPARRQLSTRGKKILTFGTSLPLWKGPPKPFRPQLPAIDAFPYNVWEKLSNRQLKQMHRQLLASVHPLGYRPLREAIANYLQIARGIRCQPDQVVIVAGAQQGLEFIARLLLDVNDAVWIEDPGFIYARRIFELAGLRLVSVRVDDEGLDVEFGKRAYRKARLAYVTPSSQWPLGVTMSLSRRLELLDWAKRNNSWIIEDDYNGEYCFAGRPLQALCGLDDADRVIYLGTFSKLLFPSLRLA